MAISFMKDAEEGEEVAQETFARALHDLGTFQGDSKFGTWLISIALNESRNKLHRREKFRTISYDETRDEEMPLAPVQLRKWRELPSEIVEDEDIKKLLDQAVNMLPDVYQQVFLLRDVEGLNLNDTASVLNISTSLVKLRSHRARLMLQRLLVPQLREHHKCLEEKAVAENRNAKIFERHVINSSDRT